MKLNTTQLILILGGIILFIPPIITLDSAFDFFNFTETGQIGDTIGGVTGPFINAIGAILIFLAFKEQIKANDLIKEQQYFQSIQDQINRLEDDVYNLSKITDGINQNLSDSSKTLNNFDEFSKQVTFFIDRSLLNKAIYITSQFQQALELVEKLDHNRNFMGKKIQILYKIIYQEEFLSIGRTLNNILHMESDSITEISELQFHLKDLEEKLGKEFQN